MLTNRYKVLFVGVILSVAATTIWAAIGSVKWTIMYAALTLISVYLFGKETLK